jgi:hypothetical protein
MPRKNKTKVKKDRHQHSLDQDSRDIARMTKVLKKPKRKDPNVELILVSKKPKLYKLRIIN